ncbi:cyclically-permuted mutarotase family protein [Phocaeicola sp.]|uniref:cyclically-permuted mutarotase family protein n=1 Tax=Phocaeicola sp. TaxID=2773926 RepID=UPI0023C22A67|nr:cyclically-permuted mutarotase family protein [Phocaeicola sp.]MDE5678191.1 cyclically-permuted mutarotase family protein [Phocaeicola sp.]
MIRQIIYGVSAIMVMTSCCDQSDACEISLEKMHGFPTEDAGFLKGVSALYAGVTDGKLLMAGGCNFPDVPAADGGKKVFYSDVYITPLSGDTLFEWKKVGQLPQAAAYGVTISTEKGLICVGGTTATQSLSDVFLLSLQKDMLRRDTLPSLPVTIDNMAGALSGHSLYIVGGNVNGVPSSAVYVLDLSDVSEGWKRETNIPGPPRVQPVCVAQGGKVYVWGGFTPAIGGQEASLSVDGYVYSPEKKEWLPVATPCDAEGNEISLGGGVGTSLGEGMILCAGGVDKDIFLKALQGIYAGKEYLSHSVEWYRFNRHLLLYHPRKDEWTSLGEYEQGARAGAAMVSQEGSHYIINGELKPGIRTNEINRIKENRK